MTSCCNGPTRSVATPTPEHDLLNAYRQWPVRHPSHNATFLHTRHGLTLWSTSPCASAQRHWCGTSTAWRTPYNSSRGCYSCWWGHYVDDFNGVEYAEHSSAFHAFSEFFHVLGLRVQDSKAQPPANRHVLQSIDVHVRQDGVTLSPTPRRVAKLRHAISRRWGPILPPPGSRTPGMAGSADWPDGLL